MHKSHHNSLQEPALHEMLHLYKEKSYWQRLGLMFAGLGRPHESREYKIARTELQRQAAPLLAITLPLLTILLLALLAKTHETEVPVIQTEIKDPVVVEKLKELLKRDPPPDPLQLKQVDFTPANAMNQPVITPDETAPLPQKPIVSVLPIPSPIVIPGIFSDPRSPGKRTELLGDHGGNQATETAVIRALRWLKTQQNADGSWGPNKTAMTSLVLLSYLAHGEKPDSKEFGDNVLRGIEYLLKSQPASGQWPGNYEHYIATYALSEAYGMTQNPTLRVAVDRAVKLIIEGQHPTGGWDYALKQNDRDDTSVMGWAAQALKAAIMADFYSDPEALLRASKLSVKGFQQNADASGGFGYVSKGRGGLTSVGVLGMQFHNAGNYPEVRKSLELMDSWIPAWNGSTPQRRLARDETPAKVAGLPPGANTQYYYYYATQAMFQSGGKRWERWNGRMWPDYVKAQFVEEQAIADPQGVMQDIGWWENGDNSGSNQRPVMDTCLAALQLMVYYRYLPTFKAVDIPGDVIASVEDSGDIKVDSSL